MWDGRTGSIAQVREAANQAQEEMRLHEQQLRERGQHPDQKKQSHGIGPEVLSATSFPPSSAVPSLIPPLLPPPVMAASSVHGDDGAPDAKRARLDGAALVPPLSGPPPLLPLPPLSGLPPTLEKEDSAVLVPGKEWMELCSGHVELVISVQVPNDAANAKNWTTLGQMLSIETEVTATVLSLKEILRTKLGGKIPLNKFQLKHATRGFIKDHLTFADLNFRMDVKLEMQLKTRKRRR